MGETSSYSTTSEVNNGIANDNYESDRTLTQTTQDFKGTVMSYIKYGICNVLSAIGGAAIALVSLYAYKNSKERRAEIDKIISTHSEQTAALKEHNTAIKNLQQLNSNVALDAKKPNADGDWQLVCKWEKPENN